MLHLKYSISTLEFQEFVYYANWLSPDAKDYRFQYYFFTMVIYLVLGCILIFSMGGNAKFELQLAILAFVGFILFLFLRNNARSYPYKLAAKLIDEEGGSETITATRDVTISESGIVINYTNAEEKFSWAAIKRKIQHNNCFYLYTAPRNAIIIPKRIFTDTKDFELFETYLSRYLLLVADFPKI